MKRVTRSLWVSITGPQPQVRFYLHVFLNHFGRTKQILAGVAWALSTIPEGAELDLTSTFPPSKESKQAPSRLSLPEDNLQQHQRDTKWGYEVGPDQVSCSWTKLLLFPRDAKHAMDDQELEKFSATGIFHLPSRWTQRVL